MNRLEDSLILWKQVVSNRLLGGVNIVLFLNKCDLLQVNLFMMAVWFRFLLATLGQARGRSKTKPAHDIIRRQA